LPYKNTPFERADLLRRIINQELRPPLADLKTCATAKSEVTALLQQCWAGPPERRPRFSAILETLSRLKPDFPAFQSKFESISLPAAPRTRRASSLTSHKRPKLRKGRLDVQELLLGSNDGDL
jgi:hypothetical protein